MNDYLSHDIIAAVGGSWLASREDINSKDWKKITSSAKSAIAKSKRSQTMSDQFKLRRADHQDHKAIEELIFHSTNDWYQKHFNKNNIYALTAHKYDCNKSLNCNCTRQYHTEKGLMSSSFDGFVFKTPIKALTLSYSFQCYLISITFSYMWDGKNRQERE